MGLLPSAIGGRDARLAYLNGQTCFNDAKMLHRSSKLLTFNPTAKRISRRSVVNDAENLFVQGKGRR